MSDQKLRALYRAAIVDPTDQEAAGKYIAELCRVTGLDWAALVQRMAAVEVCLRTLGRNLGLEVLRDQLREPPESLKLLEGVLKLFDEETLGELESPQVANTEPCWLCLGEGVVRTKDPQAPLARCPCTLLPHCPKCDRYLEGDGCQNCDNAL